MIKGTLSNLLRRLHLMHLVDSIRFKKEGIKNRQINEIFKRENPDLKLPPDYLIYESFQLNYEKYYVGGRTTAEWILDNLNNHVRLEQKKVLDWGCGPARVVRHMPQLSPANDFFGTDYNARSISWCKKNIEDVSFNHNGLDPSLPYEDGFFDAIYGISIFTHLSEEMHYKWIEELRRILAIDGVILLTTQGDNFRGKLSAAELKSYDEGQLILRGKVKEGHRVYSAFHPDAFLKKLFAGFDVLDKQVTDKESLSYTPQDTWILRKRTPK